MKKGTETKRKNMIWQGSLTPKGDNDRYVYKNIEDNLNVVMQSATQALMSDFDLEEGSPVAYITAKVTNPLPYFAERKGVSRTALELEKAFETFKDLCIKINEKVVFSPTVNTFCNFIAISPVTFRQMCNENTDRGEVASIIKSYLEDNLMHNILNGKVSTVGGIFVAKANMGMRDNDNQQVNIVNVNAETRTLEEILENFEKNRVRN